MCVSWKMGGKQCIWRCRTFVSHINSSFSRLTVVFQKAGSVKIKGAEANLGIRFSLSQSINQSRRIQISNAGGHSCMNTNSSNVMSNVNNMASAWVKFSLCISLPFSYGFHRIRAGYNGKLSQTPVLCFSVCSIVITVFVKKFCHQWTSVSINQSINQLKSV